VTYKLSTQSNATKRGILCEKLKYYLLTIMTIHKINFYLSALKEAPEHQELFTYIDRLTQMQQAFMELIPPQLAESCSLGRFSDGKLTVLVGNGAVAAKLKQFLPSLLLKFQKRGYGKVTAIQITVQANYYTYSVDDSSRERPEIGHVGAESLRKFATSLPVSPLQIAVESMLKKRVKPPKKS